MLRDVGQDLLVVGFAVAFSATLVLAAFGRPAADKNRPPAITSASPSAAVDEVQPATNSGDYQDPSGSDTVVISSSVGNVTKTGTNSGNWSWRCATTDGGVQGQTVAVTATDNRGNAAGTTFGPVVNNVALSATFNSQPSVEEDTPFEISLSNPDDPSPADKSAGFCYAFGCGDGRGFVDDGNVASKTCRVCGRPGGEGQDLEQGRRLAGLHRDRHRHTPAAAGPRAPGHQRDLGPGGTVRNASATFDFACARSQALRSSAAWTATPSPIVPRRGPTTSWPRAATR